jgi:hypothetical protein
VEVGSNLHSCFPGHPVLCNQRIEQHVATGRVPGTRGQQGSLSEG